MGFSAPKKTKSTTRSSKRHYYMSKTSSSSLSSLSGNNENHEKHKTHVVIVGLGLNVVELLQQFVDAGRQRRRQTKRFEFVAVCTAKRRVSANNDERWRGGAHKRQQAEKSTKRRDDDDDDAKRVVQARTCASHRTTAHETPRRTTRAIKLTCVAHNS